MAPAHNAIFFSLVVSTGFRERERRRGGYRTGIELSGLDNAGKSVPFLHGLERFPASVQLFLGSDPR